jgi:hypothetical protein
MACKFDVSDVCWMILRPNIIMLKYAGTIEVGNEWRRWLERPVGSVFDGIIKDWTAEIFRRIEIFVHFVYFRVVAAGLLVGVANGTKAFPERLCV